MSPIELREKGCQALVISLGAIDAARFLQMSGWGTGDYTVERQQRLSSVTREDFWQDIQRLRESKIEIPPSPKSRL